MKLASVRRRDPGLPGVSGVARLDRRVSRLVGRLNPGDIAIVDHVDIDRVTAQSLIDARVAAVINAQPSISGRYPNLGPSLLVDAGVPILDNVGNEVFGAVKEGTKIRIDGDTVYQGTDAILHGNPQDSASIETLMAEARGGLATQLEAFAANTSEFIGREQKMLLEGVGIPTLKTSFARRHAVVVVQGIDHAREIKALKHYIREYRPRLIGVDGGAEALVAAGHTPDVIVGDLDSVSASTLKCGAEVVIRASVDGVAPALPRVQDLGVDALTFPTSGTGEDMAILLADHGGAELIVTVGTHATLTEFLDHGRAGMASTFLTRLRVGGKLVDAAGVKRLYHNRVSAAALLLLVVAMLVAVIAALAVSETGRAYLTDLTHYWTSFTHWVKELFS